MTIEQKYIDAAMAHGLGTERGQYEVANKAADRLLTFRDELYEMHDHGAEILKRLVVHPNKHVARWAAGHLLPVDEAVAIAVLEKIIVEDKGIGGFNAEMVLSQWRSRPAPH